MTLLRVMVGRGDVAKESMYFADIDRVVFL